MKFKLLAAFFAVSLFTGVAAYAADFSKTDIEKIIKEYIASHGDEISSSLDRFLTQEEREAAERTIIDHSPFIGDGDAAVTFIEYGDYRCGYCKRVQKDLAKLAKKYDGKVKFAFKFLPILSEESRLAAFAALAAHKQGKFWEYHEKMWENQSRLGEGDSLLVQVAKDIDLNMKKFNKDRASKAIEAEVYDDISDARALGIRGTPYFVIDGASYPGVRKYPEFVRLLDKALADAKR